MHQPKNKEPVAPTPSSDATLSGRAIALSSIDISSVMDTIKSHNESNGVGPTLGRLIIGMFHRLKDTPREDINPKTAMHAALGDEDAHRASLRGSLEAELMPTLALVGLSVGPLRTGWAIYGTDSQFNAHRLACHVNDATQFKLYLESLDSSTLLPSQKRGLDSLLQALCTQLRSDYDVQQSDDRLLALVSAADAIVTNYERLDIPSKRFRGYVDAVRGRYLRDLIRAEALQLDKPFGKGDGFTLRWHRDSQPQSLQARWDSVVDTLFGLSQSPAAAKIYQQASETAKEAIVLAVREVSAWPQKNDGSYFARREEFLTILKRAELRLSEF